MDPIRPVAVAVGESSPGPVVVGYDGSAGSRRAVGWATREASHRRVPLRVVVAADDTGVPGAHRTATRRAPLRPADAEEALADAVALAEAHQPGVIRAGAVRRGQPGGVLVDQSRTAQVLVVGCRGRTGLPASESSTSIITASRSGCPVVVVRGRPDPRPREAVVVGVAVGPETIEGPVRYAVEHASREGAPLVLACGWGDGGGTTPRMPRPTPADRAGPLATVVRDLRHQAQESLDRALALAQRLDPGLEIRGELVDARPERALEGLSWGASLLVLGRGGTGPFPGLPLGPVTRSLLEHAGCPVVVLPAPEAPTR
ncbi:universal stress protein [Phycicoccus ginsengisoli]